MRKSIRLLLLITLIAGCAKYTPETPAWPENPPDNWVTFHLAHPGPGNGEPGDPNPAYYYKGLYHLHYIYEHKWGFAYAHVSSKDLVRWNWHPTVLTPPITGHGMFSGTGFFTLEGQPAMIYHGEGSENNYVLKALDDSLNHWAEPVPTIALDADGNPVEDMDYWDPDLWISGDTYYALSGGEDPSLMKSKDLKTWIYLDRLLHEDYPDDLGVERDEDISCANMFPIGGKWMLLCISHRLGCRYFLGDFRDEHYLPDSHYLMNWVITDWEGGPPGLVYFAPESVIAGDGRRVMWAWMITEQEPTAIQSLPRELELPEDGELRIRPLKELESLRYDEWSVSDVSLRKTEIYRLREVTGDAVELEMRFEAPLPESFAIGLLGDSAGKNIVPIRFGAGRNNIEIGNIKPPFKLKEGEDLTLRIFIDKGIVEVFVNDRQAAAVYAKPQPDPNVSIAAEGALNIGSIKSWKMKTIYR